MSSIQISLKEVGQEPRIAHIRVDGVIDTMTASELEEVLDSLLQRSRFRLVIDLAGVDYISSAGWGIFIAHIRDVRAHDGDIKLVNLLPDVLEVFRLLEFDNVLTVHASIDDAMREFGHTPESSKKKEMTKNSSSSKH